MKRVWIAAALILLLSFTPSIVFAQTYYFELQQLSADVYINEDGSTSILYSFTFYNYPTSSPIDYVDIGMPNPNFTLNDARAEAGGQSVSISRSDYAGDGSGFAVVMGSQSIQPGQTGTVHVYVPNAGSWLRYDDKDKNYASFEFSPTWFGSKYVTGSTSMQVTIHLPPGVQPAEPRWHEAPKGFPAEPQTGIDEQGRVTYTWTHPNASGSSQYLFGASFPTHYVPAAAVVKPSIFERLGISKDTFFTFMCCGGIFAGIVGIGWLTSSSTRRRRLQYLPPKIAIEGMGIKRGLTAVEAGVLMEQPLDKVMTMILFGALKKSAATVKTRDPLEIEVVDPLPADLNPYEVDFLRAFQKENKFGERRKALQAVMIDLVNTVSNKMKGFSRKETIDYYRTIMEKAWKQVEDAQTPEVKSETYDKYLEWTMLDKNYDDRTREVFRTGPVFIPSWWGRYDPTFSRPAASGPMPSPSTISRPSGGGPGGGISLPTLPGGTFAASLVNGVENFSAGVVGNVTEFTSSVTNKTNPVPIPAPSSYSGGSRSGGGCACACACAGCACACAGGGR